MTGDKKAEAVLAVLTIFNHGDRVHVQGPNGGWYGYVTIDYGFGVDGHSLVVRPEFSDGITSARIVMRERLRHAETEKAEGGRRR